jgi:sulfate adenylyltransferase
MVNLRIIIEALEEWQEKVTRLPSARVTEQNTFDLELLAAGALSPLDRFMGNDAHARILGEMRLSDRNVFPIPITLPVSSDDNLKLDQQIALSDFIPLISTR